MGFPEGPAQRGQKLKRGQVERSIRGDGRGVRYHRQISHRRRDDGARSRRLFAQSSQHATLLDQWSNRANVDRPMPTQ